MPYRKTPVAAAELGVTFSRLHSLIRSHKMPLPDKDSSGDLQNTNEYLRVVPKRFSVMQGRDTLIYPSLLFGARGAVPASANVAPALCVEIYEAFQRGDHAAALAAQLRLNPIRLSLNLGTAPGGVKAALDLLGMSLGPSRSPIAPLPAEKREKMRSALEQADLL